MTLYTIVSIVIALSGSTFTAIVQFSAFFGAHAAQMRSDSTEALKFITGQLTSEGTQQGKAKRRYGWIGFWHLLWRLAGLPPILVLVIFSFTVAFRIIGGLGKADQNVLTDGTVGFYRTWLVAVVVVNAASLVAKIVSLLLLEWHCSQQRQCRQLLLERMPVGQVITPETLANRPQATPAQ